MVIFVRTFKNYSNWQFIGPTHSFGEIVNCIIFMLLFVLIYLNVTHIWYPGDMRLGQQHIDMLKNAKQSAFSNISI